MSTAELQLYKVFASDTESAFLDLNLSIHNDTVSTKNMINGVILILLIFRSFIAMSLGVPLMVYIYLNLFALPEHLPHVNDCNNRNKFLTAKLLKQRHRYHKIRKAFSKFYRTRHFELIEKYHVSLKKLL